MKEQTNNMHLKIFGMKQKMMRNVNLQNINAIQTSESVNVRMRNIEYISDGLWLMRKSSNVMITKRIEILL